MELLSIAVVYVLIERMISQITYLTIRQLLLVESLLKKYGLN